MKSVILFQNELLAITQWGSQFYEEKVWKDFDMDWNGMKGLLHKNFQLMVLSIKERDLLFAFFGPAGR